MSDAPRYVSQQELPGSGGNTIYVPQPQAIAAEAAERTAGAAEGLFDRIKKANDTTASLNGLADYYGKVDALKQAAMADPDPATATERFHAATTDLQAGVLKNVGQLDPDAQARIRLHMTTKGIVDQNEVWNAARARQSDAASASLIALGRQSQTDAVTAPTPVARDEAIRRYTDSVEAAAGSGLISRVTAENHKLTFDNSLDHADAMAAIKRDPRAALAALDDEKQFPTLTPVQRETYAEHARQAVDRRGTETAIAAGAAFPAAASMIAGRIVHPGDTDQIFDKVILGLESGGANLPPNDKGAFGPAQLMPGTARDMAKAIGRDDLAAMDDRDLTETLMKDPSLNRQLGLNYWHDLQRRYEGNVPLMMAAYNAGPGNADKWKADAEAKFGRDFTGAQFASVVPFKETRDYIAKGYGMAGARLDAFGVSPAGRYEMGVKLGHELTTEETRRNHIVDQMASVAMADDPVIGMLKQGIDVDPGRLAQTRTALVDAAATGSVENIKRLRDFDFAAAIQPQVAQAYRLPFGTLDAAVNQEQARIDAPGANPSWQEVQGLAVLKATRGHIAKARDDDPTGLLVRAGIARPVALDPKADPIDPAFRAALGARGAQAMTAQQLYGGSAAALSPAETDTLKERWKEAGANERFGILKAMADTLPGAAYMDTAKKITGADAGEFTARLLQSRPELARELLNGEDLLKSKGIDKESKQTRQALAETLGGQIFPDAREHAAAVDAAIKIDMSRRAASGNAYDESATGGVAKAFQDVAGEVVKRNGARTVAPPGMRAGGFTHVLDDLGPLDLERFGGARDANGQPMDAAWLGRNAQLKPLEVGGSRYLVTTPTADGRGAAVMTKRNLPLVVDMHELAAVYAAKSRLNADALARTMQGKTALPSHRELLQAQFDQLPRE